jgi:hypothetical protein
MTEAETDDASLDAPTFERIGAVCVSEAESFVLGVVSEYVQRGASTSQALDMYATGQGGLDKAEWARETSREPSSVRQSVRRGWQAVEESEG